MPSGCNGMTGSDMKFLIILSLLISCVTVPKKPPAVKAFDNQFNVIAELKGKEAEDFHELWNNKEELKIDNPVFNCKIDVTQNGVSTRWLYNSRNGYCKILTMRVVPVYTLKDFKKINLRLGIR